MYEHRHEPLLPRKAFARRVFLHALIAILILLASLGAGMAGYHWCEGEKWIDAYADAAMILSGMGPLGPLQTESGKIFAGCYAIFSGVIFLTTVGVFLAPIVHRWVHHFHIGEGAKATDKK